MTARQSNSERPLVLHFQPNGHQAELPAIDTTRLEAFAPYTSAPFGVEALATLAELVAGGRQIREETRRLIKACRAARQELSTARAAVKENIMKQQAARASLSEGGELVGNFVCEA